MRRLLIVRSERVANLSWDAYFHAKAVMETDSGMAPRIQTEASLHRRFALGAAAAAAARSRPQSIRLVGGHLG